MAKKKLNIGLVGYGFMGRTHSNAFLQAPRYFDLPEPVLKAVAARNRDRVQQFAANWGYESARPTGARSSSARTSISSTSPARTTRMRRSPWPRRAGKMVMCEKPLARTAAEAERWSAPSRRPAC